MSEIELIRIADALHHLVKAVTPHDMPPGKDATEGYVGCLTEAVMGVTAGLCRIADALESISGNLEQRRLEDENL